MAARDVILVGVLVFVFATAFFVVHYISNVAISSMIGISEINESNATMEALQGSIDVTNRLDYVVFGLFIGLVLAMIITGWFVGGNPIFMFIYFLVTVMGVVLATVLANVWEEVSGSSIFGTTITAFPISNNLMSNLPIYIAVVGFIGLVVMFAKPSFTSGGEY